MAILWADTFNKYGTNTALMLNGLYATTGNSSLTADPDPTATGNVLSTVSNAINGYQLRRVFGGSKTAMGFAIRLWLVNLPPNNSTVPAFVFLNGGSGQEISLVVDTTGKILVIRGAYSGGTQIGATTVPVITANAWQHIEFKATANATTGSFEVRVNGSPVLTVTGVNTGTDYSQFAIENPISTAQTLTYYVKDLIAWDTLGSFNNTFLGSCQVLDLLPSSDVSFNWAASSGTTGWNLIKNVPPLDDAAYIGAAFPAPAASTFNVTDLPSTTTSVKALIVEYRVRKIDGGDGSVQAGLKSGATTGLGANRPITTAYTYYEDVFETDPATAAAWTIAAANAVQLYLNRTV